MLEAAHDQALGLRRMFADRGAATYSIVGAAGTSAVTRELAAALARAGREVLIIDRTCGEIATALDRRARYDLTHVLEGVKHLDDVLLGAGERIHVLPAARALAALDRRDPVQQHALKSLLETVRSRFDHCLVNGLAPIPRGDGQPCDVIIVAAPDRESVTAAYTQIKALAARPERFRLQLLVNRARTERCAQSIYTSLAQTAQRFLAARVDYGGFLPPAEDAPARVARAVAGAAAARSLAFARIAERLVSETTSRFAAA